MEPGAFDVAKGIADQALPGAAEELVKGLAFVSIAISLKRIADVLCAEPMTLEAAREAWSEHVDNIMKRG